MNIFVCIKQVPSTNQVQVDEKTGVLKRSGVAAKMNPYDLYALETALRLRSEHGGKVTVGTMGCAQQADFFSWNSVLVHTGDGRNIILVETRGDNDYPDLYVFEAGSKGPRAIGKMEGMAFAAAYREASGDDGEFLEEYPALDPSAFALKEWSDQGNKDVLFYEIGEDGMPVQLAD